MDRRSELLRLITLYHVYRHSRPRLRSRVEEHLRAGFGRLGLGWTGTLDIPRLRAALNEVKAQPGEYLPGTYERARRQGLPAWAALAAGMHPTPPGIVAEAEKTPRLPVDPDRQPAIDDLILAGRYADALHAARRAYGLTMNEAFHGVLARKRELAE
jgi:hypothetical protein